MKKKKDQANISYKDVAHEILAAIVSNPKEVDIQEEKIDENYNLLIKVAQEDMGRVIGKEGKIIKAIRNVLRIKAIKAGERLNLSLVE